MAEKTDTVQQIKDRLSIVDVVSQYVKLERAGSALRARCPFHSERTPSFNVSPERNTFHCFGCGVGGDMFTFVMLSEGIDFKGALKVLAEKAGVELVYSQKDTGEEAARMRLFELLEATTVFYMGQLSPAAKTYLESRGITQQTIQDFRLGEATDAWSLCVDYLKSKKFTEQEMVAAGVGRKNEHGGLSDKFRNRIIFPIGDSVGRIVGFSGRIFGPLASPDAPKYLNSPETDVYHKSRLLYGYDKAKQAMRTLNCAILVEGQMDLVASHQAGWSNTVAVSGTAFTVEHTQIIKRMTDNLILALDADAAGIKAAARAARVALQAGLNVKVVQLPEGKDPADLILQEGSEAWKLAIKDAKDIIVFLLDILESRSKDTDGFRRSVELSVLPFLNDVSSPIAREQYTTLIARRLNVSEHAIIETLARIPKEQTIAPKNTQTVPIAEVAQSRSTHSDRVRTAFAILLWQQSATHPQLDHAVYEASLREALDDTLDELHTMSDSDKEKLRFEAERIYGVSNVLSAEVESLLHNLKKDRVTKKLHTMSEMLKNAEAISDESQIQTLMDQIALLTSEIAYLHIMR
ncbi:MAG: dnaG [Candidatus Kaiserbacteria bacterium]|nr:dnaG [Candidatus Kaiserbacteria bacterium]